MSASPDIFLSYNREDADVAQRFAEGFEAQGFDVWWDQALRSGEAYDEVTEAALRGAKAVVVLWSPRSVVSRWVRAEATLADRNRTLVPARIETCDLPIMFELTQTAELSHWKGDADDLAWQAFLCDVRRMVRAEAETMPTALSMSRGTPSQARNTLTTLAVLPFFNRSGHAEDNDFADLMAEDLTAAVSVGGRYVTVVATSAVADYRNEKRDLRKIGRDLSVLFLVEGNVRRMGANFRLAVQLVEAETGKILWLQKFDRPLADLYSLQDDLVNEIALQLCERVERAWTDLAIRQPESATPEEVILRSRLYTLSGSRSGWEAAVADSRRAVARNPDDAIALAGLASYQSFLWHHGGGKDPALAKEIQDNISRARTLDPENRSVLESIATSLAWLRKPEEALPYAERAVAKGPNMSITLQVFGMVLTMLGRSDEAIATFDKILRLSPESTYANYTWRWRSVAHLRAGRFELAREAAEQALRIVPGVDSLIQSILCSASLDDWESARRYSRRLREVEPDMARDLAETIIRDVYHGPAAADQYVAIIRKIWNETEDEG